jgi:hypothetical protein
MSKTVISNAHTSNGHATNRISTVTHEAPAGSLPAWENYATALIAAEVVFSLAQGDADELLHDASAENLQEHFNPKHWIMDSGSEKVVTVALEALLARVDWIVIAGHVKAFAQAGVEA